MKNPAQVVSEIQTRLTKGWHQDVTHATGRWPADFSLGAPTSSLASSSFGAVTRWAHGWHDWANAHGVRLIEADRRIRGTDQPLPTRVSVPDLDTAARLAGVQWVRRIRQARDRVDVIRAGPASADVARALRLADSVGDTDFQLALRAAHWFSTVPEDDWRVLTPRQVPIPGLHAKWLDRNRNLVKALAGIRDLTMEKRGTRIYWTYLDPTYRASGGRLHDSLTLGDSVPLPYDPSVVLIVENKDTAVLFPALPDAVAVEGNGNASVGLLPQVPWIRSAPTLVYWGDIDQRGYEILNALRACLGRLPSVLMDEAAYETYRVFGTDVDETGKSIKLRPRESLTHLTAAERAVYDNLSNPDWNGFRRVEQERIPLATALAHVARVPVVH